jgi:hypothetical protein
VREAKRRWGRRKRRATTSSVTEQHRQCPSPSGRYRRGPGLCGCSSASNCGWVRGVWVRGDGTGASRPGAVTPRLARTPAETPGGSTRVGPMGLRLQCSAGALLRESSELINKQIDGAKRQSAEGAAVATDGEAWCTANPHQRLASSARHRQRQVFGRGCARAKAS